MSTTHLPPVPGGAAGSQQGPYYPGPYFPGPGEPGGPGPGGGGGGGSHRPRGRVLAAVAAVAALAGAGLTAGVMTGTGATGSAGGKALTTSGIARRVSPALVDVNTTLGYQHGAAAGTGIVLTSSGEVLTNNHVIEGATSIRATDIGNGHTYRAKVVGYDEGDDVAVLQLQGASGLKTATLGDSSAVSSRQKVVALGNAGGRGGAPSVATGRVTGLNQAITASDQGAATSERLTGLIQTNAGIQAGDSGGPLLNRSGQVIGMNTAASSGFQFQGQSQSQSQTQAFAIPIGKAHTIAGQITAGRTTGGVHLGPTAFLGVGLVPENQGGSPAGGQGAAISEVVPGAPAARAGLVPGDQIVSIGGHRVGSPSDVQATMVGHHPGNRVSMTWVDQAGQSHSATVTLATGPAG